MEAIVVCGRINLRTPAAAWAQEFLPLWSDEEIERRQSELGVAARYNIAPTQMVSCILSGTDSRRQWSLLRWGLIPSWADDPNVGNRMVNARSETIDEKRSFKSALRKRRCLVPADGYFEWMKTSEGKQPYLIERVDGSVLAMAAIWESNHKIAEDGRSIDTFTILTTSANEVTAAIHHRMPVLLTQEGQSIWMDPSIEQPDDLKSLFKPASEGLLKAYPVSKVVNNARNDVPECIQPAELPPEQKSLF